MKAVILIAAFFLPAVLFGQTGKYDSLKSVVMSQTGKTNPAGVYIGQDRQPKVIDSLVIKSDSTFRFAWYYTEAGGGEYSTGKWSIVNGQLILHGNKREKSWWTLRITDKDATIIYCRRMKEFLNEKLDKQ